MAEKTQNQNPEYLKGIMKYLQNLIPRDYQKEIFLSARQENSLVVLPTGLGKTLIALMLSIDRMIKHPNSKILFLAPTRPLAEQHYHYFEKNLPELFAGMNLFTGKVKSELRTKQWQSADVIFSTPQCIKNDIEKKIYSLDDVSLLIEDECHKCIKNYAYTEIAKTYLKQSKFPLILGITASPGHEREKIKEICRILCIKKIISKTREDKDVKKYLQKLETKIIKIDFPLEFQEIKTLLLEIFNKKAQELKNRKILFQTPTKIALLELQKKLMKSIINGNKNFNNLIGASLCATCIKLQHALELLETQTLFSFLNYLEDLEKQASQSKSKGVMQLVKNPCFIESIKKTRELIEKNQEHPKLKRLKQEIQNQIKSNPKSKVIVFAQFRDTVVRICKELNSIKEINAKVFIGQAKKPNSKNKENNGLSQKEQQEIIKEFSFGKVNCLVSTSIGEEGLDLPEISSVFFYEPIPSAIRQIQRRGRTARLKPGKLIILMTTKTRDEVYYWASFHKEKKMHKSISSLQEDMSSGKLNLKNKQKNINEFNKK
jgi:ERCC4-related helicase